MVREIVGPALAGGERRFGEIGRKSGRVSARRDVGGGVLREVRHAVERYAAVGEVHPALVVVERTLVADADDADAVSASAPRRLLRCARGGSRAPHEPVERHGRDQRVVLVDAAVGEPESPAGRRRSRPPRCLVWTRGPSRAASLR